MSIEKNKAIHQYLTFNLDEEVYAASIHHVREVLDFTDTTKVPRMPDFMRGVINLRGSVVPVVDLRLKFGMGQTQQTVDTCIIIMELSFHGEAMLIGALADSVKEVVSLEPDHINPPPEIGTRLQTEFIRGMGKNNDNFIIILDMDKVFFSDEFMAQTVPKSQEYKAESINSRMMHQCSSGVS